MPSSIPSHIQRFNDQDNAVFTTGYSAPELARRPHGSLVERRRDRRNTESNRSVVYGT